MIKNNISIIVNKLYRLNSGTPLTPKKTIITFPGVSSSSGSSQGLTDPNIPITSSNSKTILNTGHLNNTGEGEHQDLLDDSVKKVSKKINRVTGEKSKKAKKKETHEDIKHSHAYDMPFIGKLLMLHDLTLLQMYRKGIIRYIPQATWARATGSYQGNIHALMEALGQVKVKKEDEEDDDDEDDEDKKWIHNIGLGGRRKRGQSRAKKAA